MDIKYKTCGCNHVRFLFSVKKASLHGSPTPLAD